jgi:hypothetical protein
MKQVVKVAGLWLLLVLTACSSKDGNDKSDGGGPADQAGETDLAIDLADDETATIEDLVEDVSDLVDGTGELDGDPDWDSLDAAETDGSGPLLGEWVQLSNSQLGEHVLKGIWGFDDGNVVAVGEAGLVAALVQDTFVPSYQEPSLNILNGVWGSSSSDIWTVGMYGLIYHYDGIQWGMPAYCQTVADCSFAGTCLLAECEANECVYQPTGKKECCGADHVDTGVDDPAGISFFTMEDVYQGTPDGGMTWHVASVVSADGQSRYMTAPNALYFGEPTKTCAFDQDKVCPDFNNGKKVGATASSNPVTLPLTAELATLNFYLYLDVEASPFVDKLQVRVFNGGKWEEAWDKSYLSGNYLKNWIPVQVDLSKYIGKTVRFQFHFDSVTAENNALEGVYIDNIKVSTTCSVAGALAGKFPTLWSVWGASEKSVYAVGSEGWILHYNGTSWQKHNGGENFQVKGVHGVSKDDVLLVGKSGLVLHTQGEGWEKESSGLSKDLNRVWGTSPTSYVAVGSQGALAWYDGNWHPSSMGGMGDLNDVIGFSDTDYYIVGQTGKFLHWNGSDFSDVPTNPTTMNLHSIWGETSKDLVVVGDKTVLMGSIDSLQIQSPPIVAGWRAAWGIGQDKYVAGESGMMLHYTGSEWTKMASGVTQTILGLWGFGTDDIFAVGEAATLLHYDGEKWEPMKAFGGEDTIFSDVWGSAPDDVYVTAQIEDIGYLLHYDGLSWKISLASTTANLRHIHGTSDENVFAVGQKGTIVRYDGKGWGLSPVDPYPLEDGSEFIVDQGLFGVYARNEVDAWAVGEAGVIVHYDGASFSLAGLFDYTLRAVWSLSPENVWAVGGAGVIMRFDGAQWYQEPSGTVATLYAIWGDQESGNIFAVGDNGTVLKYETYE